MQGWFDVEIQAKTIREEMQRTAERQRMIDEAFGRGQRLRRGSDFSVGRLLESARAWLVGQRTVDSPSVARPLPDAANVSLIVSSQQDAASCQRPPASSELYSGMHVIARGKRSRSLEEASGARER